MCSVVLAPWYAYLPPLRRLLARLGELGELVFLPLAAAFGEDAFEEDGGGFGVGVLRPPVLGELALDRRLEDGGPIPLQVGSHSLQGDDPGIEVGEEFLDLGDDAALLVERGNREEVFQHNVLARLILSVVLLLCLMNQSVTDQK